MEGLKAIDRDGEISALLAKVGSGLMDAEALGAMLQWTRRWFQLKALLERKEITFKQLKTLRLGLDLEEGNDPSKDGCQDEGRSGEGEEKPQAGTQHDKHKGHGKISAKDYSGCRKVDVAPEDLAPRWIPTLSNGVSSMRFSSARTPCSIATRSALTGPASS